MRLRTTFTIAAALWVGAAGCHIRPRPLAPNASEGTIITRAQIAGTGARTMWDALQRTVKYTMFQQSGTGTPERIQRRGSSTIVLTDEIPIFVDHVKIADVTLLAQMNAIDIEQIQVLNGVHATTYYGTNAGDGVILIYTREARANGT